MLVCWVLGKNLPSHNPVWVLFFSAVPVTANRDTRVTTAEHGH